MKKNYFIAILALIVNLASAQIEPTTYRGAFAPAPTPMWTDSWANWDPQNEPYTDPAAANVVSVTTNITTNTTWTYGKTYKLTGLIYVTNGATLTIQPGVIVKGVYTNTGTALIITKGSKIDAVGTADRPIVFTSNKAAGQRAAGDWGGVILLGKAGFNLNNGINNIEGITASVYTEYGGGTSPIHTDNSGTMKYCRIEFPGFVFSPNNEINGLTLGAVGSGTTIDYVQVSYSGDDSFEWFGGSVNCKHIVAYKGLDDDFDTDNGYKGIVQFALGVRDPSISDNPSISTSEGFESDNNAGGTVTAGTDNTSAIFTNCTLIGPKFRASIAPTVTLASGHERALRLRRASELKVFNSIFLDFKSNILFIDGTAALANATAATPKLIFKNNTLAGALDASTPTAFASGFNLNGTNPATIPSYLASNTVQASNASVLTKAYGSASTDWAAGNFTNSPSNLDYRPVSSTGADFSDSSFTPYVNYTDKPTITNLTYCKGDVASPLTATLTNTGIVLKWYTAATGGTPSFIAPTPVTTTAPATLNYWVSQISNTGLESARVLITVTVNALPADVLTAITGIDPDGLTTTAAITTVSKFVGTTSTYTYSTSGIGTGTTYLWTVPNGVTITEGQGTATIKVNYANVPAGAGTIGTINVQAVNSNGCKTVAKTLTITKALPLAPATISLFNKNTGYATPTTAITNYGNYMGQSTALTLTAAASVGASAYKWELPAGVSLAIPSDVTPVTTTKTYTAEPFLSPNTPATTVAGKYWVVTKNDYTFPVNNVPTTISVSTAKQNIVGSGSCKFTLTSGTVGSIINVGTPFTYNGDTYVLSTATAATDTAITCAIVFPLVGGNYPTATTSSSTTTTIGTLTNVSTSATFNFKRVEVTPARTYTFTAKNPRDNNVCSVGTEFTYNGDTYVVATAVTATSCKFTLKSGTVGIVIAKDTEFTYDGNTYNLTAATAATDTSITCTMKYVATANPYPNASATVEGALTYSGGSFTFSKFDLTASSIVCKPSALPQPAGNYPSTNPSTDVSGTLTRVGTGNNIEFKKIVKANYDVTTSQDYPSYGTVITSNLPSILVKFNGVTSSSTTKLYIGVKAINGVGTSVTSNTTNTDVVADNNIPGLFNPTYTEVYTAPVATTFTNATSTFTATGKSASTAKLLTLTATVPLAPAAVTLTDPNSSTPNTGITIISKYLGTERALKLSATASVLASSYAWELPSWVNVVSGNAATDREITVNLAGNVNAAAPSGVTSYYFGAKAVNLVGPSTVSNATLSPSTTSTARLLKVTTSSPAVITAVTGQLVGLCGTYEYTMTASALANSYRITAPTGSVVKSANNATNDSNVLTTSDLTFTVTYPSNFSVIASTSVADKSISITSVNTVGYSTTDKVLTLATALGAIGTNTNSYGTGALASKFGKCTPQTISVPAVPYATSYVWTLQNGATGTSTTNSIVVDFSMVSPLTASVINIIKVKAANACGVFGAEKSISLTYDNVSTCAGKMASPVMVSEVSIYPNPATDNFNLELTTSVASEMSMTIYSLNGATVRTKNIQLSEGNNVINEDISSLANGIYFVRFNNPTNNETIVRKLIKI